MNSYYPMNTYNKLQELQNMKDRIDNQMMNLQQYQNPFQTQQPMQPITQNFQLAPNNPNTNELEGKYAENIDEVRNTFVIKTGIFVNKDLNKLWLKDVSGNIKEFDMKEVVQLDEKDKQIIELQNQINQLKGELSNANDDRSNTSNINESFTSNRPSKVSSRK